MTLFFSFLYKVISSAQGNPTRSACAPCQGKNAEVAGNKSSLQVSPVVRPRGGPWLTEMCAGGEVTCLPPFPPIFQARGLSTPSPLISPRLTSMTHTPSRAPSEFGQSSLLFPYQADDTGHCGLPVPGPPRSPNFPSRHSGQSPLELGSFLEGHHPPHSHSLPQSHSLRRVACPAA